MKGSRQNIAYHEAGHAVAAIAQGLTVNEIAIRDGDDYGGVVSHPNIYAYRYTNRREFHDIARSLIRVSFAGLEGERLVDSEVDDESATADFAAAFRHSLEWELPLRSCDYPGDAGHLRYLGRKRNEARRLVRRESAAVESLGHELLANDVVDRERAEAIVTPKLVWAS